MSETMDASTRAALEAIVGKLESAWNEGSGEAFAVPFAEDADFVTIRGEHMRGRTVIAAGHDALFRTIYAGSRNQCAIEAARLLRPDVALVHVRAVMDAPSGPLEGRHGACFSLIVCRAAAGWEIAALHNTLQAAPVPQS
ncbi:MAG: SgcJ/EcaC family oxidoreductase [Candidatus Eisenbacteria bacterium]